MRKLIDRMLEVVACKFVMSQLLVVTYVCGSTSVASVPSIIACTNPHREFDLYGGVDHLPQTAAGNAIPPQHPLISSPLASSGLEVHTSATPLLFLQVSHLNSKPHVPTRFPHVHLRVSPTGRVSAMRPVAWNKRWMRPTNQAPTARFAAHVRQAYGPAELRRGDAAPRTHLLWVAWLAYQY